MQDAITALTGIYAQHLQIIFLIFLRVGAAMALMPGFGERSVPMRIRLLLSLAFTLVIWPAVPVPDSFETSGLKPGFLLSETVTGLALGFFFRLFVTILQGAGEIAAQATSLSQLFGATAASDPMPAFGNLLLIGGLALAMAAGLHIKLAIALANSYDILPIGRLPEAADLTAWGVAGFSSAFAKAFTLATPFVILSTVYNLALGAINKAMPQLMVAFIGAPVITFGGLALLAICAPIILTHWLDFFDSALTDPFGATK